MSYINVSRSKYRQLERQAKALRELKSRLFELALQDPIDEVVDDFRRTGKYNKAFLNDLRSGLRLSSFNRYAAKALAQRSRRTAAKK
ncbi:MAG TPA: hypothetical protein VJA27_03570 [Patescibacteria group bacterium]|nr:hypothetical protein [Patescibacteria group bacterium]